jgi:hypothetical protein
MNLLEPLALLFGLLAIPIVLLYLLRLQRREQKVSSTLLWRQVTIDREANTLWQKLRKNLLLFLQLLTLAFFVFALIRPYVNVPSTISGTVVVLLDASASMRALDGGQQRFDTARAEARTLVNQLGTNDRMIIVLVDGAPRALTALTGDKTQLNDALATAQPSLSAANWSAAVALASASTGGGTDATTIVISDGAGLASSDEVPAESAAAALRLIRGKASFVPVGTSAENIAISTFTLRRGLRGVAAFVRVSNVGPEPDKVLVAVKADGALVDARELEIAPGAAAEFTVTGLAEQTSSVEAVIEQASRNALPTDDVAYAVNSSNSVRNALLLTNGNRFLEQALAALPGLRVTRSVSVPLNTSGYDLYVLDRFTMPLPARANVLAIGPEGLSANGIISTSGTFSETQYVRAETHPVTNQVDWRTVNVQTAQRINAPLWLRPLIEGRDGSLLFGGESTAESEPQRVVLIPFELRRSDLPLQIAFPILIANAVDWLAPPQGINVPVSVRPGEVVALPEGTQIIAPSGVRTTVDSRGFVDTAQPGVYRFESDAGDTELNGAFAVNFSNQSESRIAPVRNVQLGSSQEAAQQPAGTGLAQREFWHWLAAAGLLLLIIEWWVFQRGVPELRAR